MITADLQDAGWRVSQNTVAALMREQGLAVRRTRGRRPTTRPGKGRWRVPGLVKRDFGARQLNRKWFGDGTEIGTGEGKFHLVSVLDQGSEYTARSFRTACQRLGIIQSMGRPGSALDNAAQESWHSTLEWELRRLQHFTTKAQARTKVAAWIEDYNHRRRHSACQMMSPVDYEEALAA
jgi:putative transposase